LILLGYVFRVFVTFSELRAEILRDYNASDRGVTDELNNKLSTQHFCLRGFFAAELAFLAVFLGFNLLGEFQRAVGPALKNLKTTCYLRCCALRFRGFHLPHNSWSKRASSVSACSNWSSYSNQKPFFNSHLHWPPVTSPKFTPE
jgi:hypothetical protein